MVSVALTKLLDKAYEDATLDTIVNAPLPPMPLFLTPEDYVSIPLEQIYQSAWEAVPAFWRDVLTST